MQDISKEAFTPTIVRFHRYSLSSVHVYSPSSVRNWTALRCPFRQFTCDLLTPPTHETRPPLTGKLGAAPEGVKHGFAVLVEVLEILAIFGSFVRDARPPNQLRTLRTGRTSVREAYQRHTLPVNTRIIIWNCINHHQSVIPRHLTVIRPSSLRRLPAGPAAAAAPLASRVTANRSPRGAGGGGSVAGRPASVCVQTHRVWV